MYIGRGNDAISNVEKLDNITFNGGTTYALTKSSAAFTPVGANNILVSIDGVIQQGNFSVSTTNIVFDWSPTSSNTNNFILHYGTGVLNVPADGAVSTVKIADGAVTAAKIADGTVVASEIADNAITTAKINADAVTGAKIADDAIDSEHYADGSIDNAHIADDQIDSEHYAAGSIDNEHLADDAVGVAELSATGTASNSTFLRGDNAWVAVTGTTINNNADNRIITGSGTANTLEGESTLTYDGTNLDLGDNKKLRLGAGQDLQIYHDGSDSYVDDAGTGNLYIRADSSTRITSYTGTENSARFNLNGSADLYHDNALKFQTASGGVTVTGTCTATTFSGSGASLTNLPAPSTANVGSATAGLGTNDVGAYCACWRNASQGTGSTSSGSSLQSTTFSGYPRSDYRSGTWRAMGQTISTTTLYGRDSTVWLRIS